MMPRALAGLLQPVNGGRGAGWVPLLVLRCPEGRAQPRCEAPVASAEGSVGPLSVFSPEPPPEESQSDQGLGLQAGELEHVSVHTKTVYVHV